MRGHIGVPRLRPQYAQERAVVALRRHLRPHRRHGAASLSIWFCTRLARVLWGSLWSNAARWLASKVAGGGALAMPHKGRPREARQAPPWAPAQLRRRMGRRTAPHAEALPNSAMVRPMIPTVFGDSFMRGRLRTQAATDGHPLAAEAHRNMLWAACENHSK